MDSNNIKFRILSIHNVNCKSHFDGMDLSSLSDDTVRFQYRIETVIKMSENVVTIIPGIRYLFDKAILFEASAEFDFMVLSLNSVMELDEENSRLNMKADILPTLLGTAYSSLRGIVFSKTASTPLERYPMPLIENSDLQLKNGISVLA